MAEIVPHTGFDLEPNINTPPAPPPVPEINNDCPEDERKRDDSPRLRLGRVDLLRPRRAKVFTEVII